jgi:membrane protein involved in colicin uptake
MSILYPRRAALTWRGKGVATVDDGAGSAHGKAAELLSKWRAAERDTAGARLAELVAAAAAEAAIEAEGAAAKAESAAAAAMEAADQAKNAAVLARDAARRAAEGAATAETRAEGDEARAGQNVADAEQAETDARDRFHEAERRGFRDPVPEGEMSRRLVGNRGTVAPQSPRASGKSVSADRVPDQMK